MTREPTINKTVAIFCRVVDHFGDAGFCWRLSVALRGLGVAHVVLVIDRLNILEDLRGSERIGGLTVLPWNVVQEEWERRGVPAGHKADLVIEAFACDPPQVYLRALDSHAQWITLDYLATEPWADDAHDQLSPHPRLDHPMATTRRWWIPGFSKNTGGLVHGSWRHIARKERHTWRRTLAGPTVGDDTFLVMAFGYGDADWQALTRAMQSALPKGFTKVVLWQPKGIAFPQSDFDAILQACDLNFVRGEDSFVRAHWAAAGPWQVPFVWQPYRQDQQGHGHKMAGWLNQVVCNPALESLQNLQWAWNGLRPAGSSEDLSLAAAWKAFSRDYARIKAPLARACERLALQSSLESNLAVHIG